MSGVRRHYAPCTGGIDCWFDSGAMPFAQHHYPFENQELFKQQFPANFISEAVDQTRGWFYSLLAESTLLFNQAPYKNVIVLGHVQDENGQKMSKSKGMQLIRLMHFRHTVQMPSAGTSTSTVHRGCRTVSMARLFRKVSVIHGYSVEYLCILCTLCKY